MTVKPPCFGKAVFLFDKKPAFDIYCYVGKKEEVKMTMEGILPERSGLGIRGGEKGKQGFASMSPEKQREIASKGGRAAHMNGTAHEWTREEARVAGGKGGKISRGGRGRLPEVVPAS
ncbi:MAG: KGG domain-containing protein [Candidatus Saccharibacteria bacterium]